jgi:LCP family protein required for cell wall assembly
VPTRPASTVRRVLAWIAGLTALSVLGVAGVGWATLNYLDAKITRVDVGLGGRGAPAPGEPVNILLVGSDSREGLSQSERNKLSTGNEGSKRSDTMILAHLSGDNQRVTLVSFPRDSYVTIPAHTSAAGEEVGEAKNKLNAAYAYGGPALAIKTIEANTGVSIDHYVEIDIAGFVDVVDALGGAEVCVKEDVYDKDSGLDLDAGKHQLDGAQSLAYVRARKIYADSDLGRIRAQQAFLGSLVRKALSADTLTDPIKLNRFLSASLSSVTTDTALDQGTILTLADRLRGASADGIRFVTVPASDLDYRVDGIGSALLWDEEKAQKVFDALKNDQPVVEEKKATAAKATVAPGAITVQVQNGTAITGLGRRAADSLADVGFGMAGAATNADASTYTRTTVKYDPTQEKALETLKASLPDAEFIAQAGLGETFLVIAGTDWTEAKKVTVASATPKAPKDELGSTTADQATCT